MNKTRFATGFTIFLIAAFLALSLYWWWSAERLEAWITAWVQDQRAQGYEITYEGPEIGGFPFSLSARLSEPQMTSPQGWRWQGSDVEAWAFLLNPFKIKVDFSGHHSLQRAAFAEAEALDADFQEAQAVVFLQANGALEKGSVDLTEIYLRPAAGPALGIGALQAQLGPLGKDAQQGLRTLIMKASLQGIDLPPDKRNLLGDRVEDLTLDVILHGLPRGHRPRTVLENWRNAGGTLEIDTLALSWGALALDSEGTVGLDHALRPAGELTARIAGYAETLTALSGAGLLPANQAVTASLALTAMASEQDASGRKVAVLPISFKQGYLYLGPLPLAPLAPVL